MASKSHEMQSKVPSKDDSKGRSQQDSEEHNIRRERPIIAVSSNRRPANIAKLAREILVSRESCDLSALEGAIVIAIDAAQLLQRTGHATIIRIETSNVEVGPAHKKDNKVETINTQLAAASLATPPKSHITAKTVMIKPHAVMAGDVTCRSTSSGRGRASRIKQKRCRRAQITITMKRSDNYKTWLETNDEDALLVDEDSDRKPMAQSTRYDKGGAL